MDQTDLKAAIEALLAADDMDGVFAAIEAHAVLLEAQAGTRLAELAAHQDSSEARDHLQTLAAILADCRERGVDQVKASLLLSRVQASRREAIAFANRAGSILQLFEGREGPVSASLHLAIGLTLQAAAPQGDLHWQESVLRAFETALGQLTRDFDSYAWALAQTGLGNAYQGRLRGERAENLERAIACYEAALQVRTREADPRGWAENSNNIANVYWNRLRGDRADNVERAIACFEAALQVLTRKTDPHGWATTSNNLGIAYSGRLRCKRADNLERAIACFEVALTVLTREIDAHLWAVITSNLGNVYLRLRGKREENVERAIACYEAALQVRTRDADAHGWASTINNLGAANFDRLCGERAENLEQAIACYEAALQVRTPEADAHGWAETTNNLGNAYSQRLRGERAENLERAIACYEAALEVRTRETDARGWASTSNNLGTVYSDRLRGERAENLERAIACLEAALHVRTREADAHLWAETRSNLGNAFARRLRGERAENLERAIACYEAALEVLARETDAHRWATISNNLGTAYSDRLRGDRAENLERAIACYVAALEVRTRETDAYAWAETSNNLGNAYARRLRGDRAENLERAIARGEAVLQVRTHQTDGYHWASTNNNLGNAYAQRLRGNRGENLERAIVCFEAALEVLTRGSDPHGWAQTTNNLGSAYSDRLRGERAENLERAIACYEAALQVLTRETNAHGWALTSNNLGNAYAQRLRGERTENLERAIACFRGVSQVGETVLDAVTVVRNCVRLAIALLRLGSDHRSAADVELRRVAAIAEQSRGETVTPEAQRELLAALSRVGRLSALIAVEKGDVPTAVERLEASRAIGLRETLSIDVLLGQIADADHRDAIVKAGQQIDLLRYEAAASGEMEGRRPYSQIAGDLREARAQMQAALEVAGHGPTPTLGINEILDTIPDGGTLIVPVATEFGGLVFVVPAGTTSVDRRHVIECPDLTEETVREQLGAWLSSYGATLEQLAFSRWDAASTQLGDLLDWLWQAAMGEALERRAELVGATPDAGNDGKDPAELLIMPTGDFALLPLHAAWRDVAGAKRAVLDDHVVSCTISLQAALTSRSRSHRASAAPGGSRLLALINPTGDEKLDFGERYEPAMLRRLFPDPADDAILVRGQASKQALFDLAAGRSYLHLSCHGRFDWGDPQRSGLLLAGGEWLTVPEIVGRLELDACRWAMLAACETGMADINSASEEAIGQVAAFHAAGAACVTATFWSVPDTSTALFAGRAYEEHLANGCSPAQAARRAALWLRDLPTDQLPSEYALATRRLDATGPEGHFAEVLPDTADETTPPFRSPLFWAAFSSWGR